MRPLTTRLTDGQPWLRVADPYWEDALDPSFAAETGGRWNPPGSFPTLYLNQDLHTARAQIIMLLQGSPIEPDDLDPGFDLVAATLPRAQTVADLRDDAGLDAVGLPATYPRYANGRPVRHEACQPVGAEVRAQGLRGVFARSAATPDGSGRELAWFPARNSSTATPVSKRPFADWWFEDG